MTQTIFNRSEIHDICLWSPIYIPKDICSYQVTKSTVVALIDFSMQNMLYKANISGTCFLIDRDRGWFLTNKHVVSANYVQSFFIYFTQESYHNAKLIYEDPEHDFSIISVDPSIIPADLPQLSFSLKPPKISDDIYFASSTSSSPHLEYKSGKIIDIDSKGYFSSQVFIGNFSILKGDSGSPVYNEEGMVLGIAFATNNKFMAILDSRYILDALNDIKSDINHRRHSSGVLFEYCDLRKMLEFSLISSDVLEKQKSYSNFPKGICVKRVFIDYDNGLEAGDLIWGIKGQVLNADLYSLQRAINLNDTLKIDLIRFNESMRFDVTTFDITKFKIEKILFIDGTIFYKAGIHTSLLFGVDPSSLFSKSLYSNSSFSQVSMSSIVKVHNTKIRSFDDLLDSLPDLMKMQSFALQKITHVFNVEFNQQIAFHKNIELVYMHIDRNTEIMLLEYIDNTWVASNIYFEGIES